MGRGRSRATPKTLFAKRLKNLIGDKNNSDFEKNIMLTAGSVARIFDGSEPTRPTLELILKGTGCNPGWLLTGDGPMFMSENHAREALIEGDEGMERREAMELRDLPNHHLTARVNLKRIRQKIGKEGMFQVCRDAGADLEDWIKWEDGDSWPSQERLEKIAIASGIDPKDITKPLPEDEWPMPIPGKYSRASSPGDAHTTKTKQNASPAVTGETSESGLSDIDKDFIERCLHIQKGIAALVGLYLSENTENRQVMRDEMNQVAQALLDHLESAEG